MAPVFDNLRYLDDYRDQNGGVITQTQVSSTGLNSTAGATIATTAFPLANATAINVSLNEETSYANVLQAKVDLLEREMKAIREILANRQIEQETLEIRDVPYDEAKRLIVRYFDEHHGEAIDATDLQDALGISVFLAAPICEELKAEGKIKPL